MHSREPKEPSGGLMGDTDHLLLHFSESRAVCTVLARIYE